MARQLTFWRHPLAVAVACAVTSQAHGLDFSIGDMTAQLDSSLSVGASWRIQKRDQNLISMANGGNKASANYDDGNLNYDSGDLTSLTAKGSHDLELRYHNYGAFVRGRYWYDSVYMDEDFDHRPVSEKARDEFGSGAKFLDMFVYGDFYLGEKPLTVRYGKQVISWGESLFIQGGINIINPFDVTAFRSPGAEIKDGILPTAKLYANFAFNDAVSVEAFIDHDWKRTEVDPCGTYFSSADFLGHGCNYAVATTGTHLIDGPGQYVDDILAIQQANMEVVDPSLDGGASELNLQNLLATFGLQTLDDGLTGQDYLVNAMRLDDKTPDDDNLQYGVSLRWFASELNNSEFGFYYVNYHSKLPYLTPVATTEHDFRSLYLGFLPLGNVTINEATGTTVSIPSTAGYQFVYPEDIDLFGFSASTSIESGWLQGLALAGEWSYRPNMPVQQSLPVFLSRALFVIEEDGSGDNVGDFSKPFLTSDGFSSASEHQMHQIQVNALYSWSEVLWASQVILAAEAAVIHLPELEHYDGNPLFNPDNSLKTDEHLLGLSVSGQNNTFVTRTSWGYRARMAFIYNDVMWGVNLIPTVSWSHDVNGYAPGPGAAFVEDRQALSFSVRADYLQKYSLNAGITTFYGTSKSVDNQEINQFHDRDFISLSFQYNY